VKDKSKMGRRWPESRLPGRSGRFGLVHDRVWEGSRRSRSSSVGSVIEGAEDTLAEGWQVTAFLTTMTSRLVSFIGFSFAAWVMFFRLVAFALVLLPAFLRVVFRYFTSTYIIREFYGPERRQSLDLYVRGQREEKAPVIVFFSGGAWIIGYKAWGALMGMTYSAAGYIFVSPDYRNFPQAFVHGMVDDVDLALEWCINNVEKYGGDKDNIVLMGQSAGAQLSAMSMLRALCRKNGLETVKSKPQIDWKIDSIRGFVGISGPYNLVRLGPRLASRGLSTSVIGALFEGKEELYSPTLVVEKMAEENGDPLVCPIEIMLAHGTSDVTCPHDQSVEFSKALNFALEANVRLELMSGLSHTDPIIELPMKALDPLMEKILLFLETFVRITPIKDPFSEEYSSPMLPIFLIDLAAAINPF